MSLKEADDLAPQIQLSTIINSLAPSDVKTERLIVLSPSYMRELPGILSSTSKEVLQTYFIWKVIQAYSSVLEADELKPYSRFSNELQGKVKSSTAIRSTLIDLAGSGICFGAVESLCRTCRQRLRMDFKPLLC